MPRSDRLWADSDNNVDPADRGAQGRRRQFGDSQILARDVLQLTGCFAEEVMVISRVGVEIRTARFDDDLMQQAAIGELMQAVVDRCERYRDPGRHRLAMQLLGGDVTFPAFEQEPCQSQALARWPEIYRP